MTRKAISPRLAIRILLNIFTPSPFDFLEEEDVFLKIAMCFALNEKDRNECGPYSVH
jgi:hypothetical protein